MNIIILYGGKSAEHEISILSANNVFNYLDKKRYSPILIKIDKEGNWLTDKEFLIHNNFSEIKNISDFKPLDKIMLSPRSKYPFVLNTDDIISFGADAVFPVLHGPNGEDGSVQGVLKTLNIPFVGPSVLGSAVGMDKEVMKRLLKEGGIKIGDYITARYNEIPDFEQVKSKLGLPVYIKPANMGSSVGISKVTEQNQYIDAINLAYQFDTKIVIEANITGREIECAIIGNEKPASSVPGEVIAYKDFYNYEAKYIDDKGYKLVIPAELENGISDKIRDIAVRTFQILECEGLSRVDVFLDKNNEVIVNEINTLPGFTKISMYPMLWKESGIKYEELISKLIELAIDRHQRDSNLKMSI
ncbi:MAG: D-alanine--D-alanine ligase family protein [Saprospiraceae bacterium]